MRWCIKIVMQSSGVCIEVAILQAFTTYFMPCVESFQLISIILLKIYLCTKGEIGYDISLHHLEIKQF
jgi:hypothetical protein